MRFLVLSLSLLALPAVAATPAEAATASEDAATCTTRHAELTKQAAGFNGDTRIKRLIDADLRRAMKEQAEGDGDECLEALDHAAKLLAGGA